MPGVIAAGGWRFAKYFFYSLLIVILISFVAIMYHGILIGVILFMTGMIISFYFFFTPSFTYHTVSKKGIKLRYGWFWSMYVPAHNIKRMSPFESIFVPYSFHYDATRGILYACTSKYNGIYLQLREPTTSIASMGRKIYGIVFNVSDLDEFKKLASKYYSTFVDESICPLCGRREHVDKKRRKKVEVKEEHAKIEHIFLVYNDGRLITMYSESGDLKTSAVASGMFTIIQDFIGDAFRAGGVTKRIEHEDMTILVEYSPHLYLFVVFRGKVDEKKYRGEMRTILNEVESTYEDELSDWDGNVTRISGAKKIISQLLWI